MDSEVPIIYTGTKTKRFCKGDVTTASYFFALLFFADSGACHREECKSSRNLSRKPSSKKSDEMLQHYKDIKAIIKDNPEVTKREIEEELGLSRQKVDRAIAHLQEQN